MKNGYIWQDENGEDIQAHGGCMLEYNGTYYWYGESYGKVGNDGLCHNNGIMCYSSKDLINWKNEGMAIEAFTHRQWCRHDLYYKNIIQRPKVIFNENIGKFVMYFHADDPNYTKASVGLAIGDTPNGKFNYIGCVQPSRRSSHDLTVFKDDDGKAYLFNASDHCFCHRVIDIKDDGIYFGKYTIAIPEVINWATREAPVVFKNNGKYYLITSACTGWAPNEAECHTADSIHGEWVSLGNPCVGENAETTFISQGAFCFWNGGRLIFAADRWNPKELDKSGYVWLEVDLKGDKPQIYWKDEWNG